MKFKSAFFTQVSGSVGGATFAHNQGGMYVRGRGLPTNPASQAQQVIRNAMSSAHAAWQNLTVEVRNAWKAYAADTPLTNSLGDSYKLSNLAMFLRQYVSRAQNGMTQIITAPDTPGLAELSPVSVARHLAQSAVDFTYNAADPWCTVTLGFLAAYQSPPLKPTNEFYKGPYKLLGHLPGDTAAPPPSPFFATSLYEFAAGQRYFFRVIAVDAQGRMSAEQSFPLDVA